MTKTITTVAELKRYVRRQKRSTMSIGLVPTMGALHEGHLSLIRRSVEKNDRTVVSIFVNPTQFGPGEDFSRYPRHLAEDERLCSKAKVNVIFAPSADEMYPEGFVSHVAVERLTKGLCGASRPGHFSGVTTVCTKLFNVVEPDRAYFGEKDYQQLTVIKRMVGDLDMNLEIVACPTVREPDGLAVSSRNLHLDEDERRHATVLYKSLCEARRLVEKEHMDRVADITRAMRKIIRSAPAAKIDYVAVVDPHTLQPLREIKDHAVVALAVFLNRTRLIDNIRVELKGER